MRGLRERFPDARLVVSRLSVLECFVKPTRDRNAALIQEYRAFFASRDLMLLEITADVVESALQLRARYGLRTPDALQAASVLTLPTADHRFLTNNRGFARVEGLVPILLSPMSADDAGNVWLET